MVVNGSVFLEYTIGNVQHIAGYPLHRENRENGQKKISCQGKHREFGNFVKTQGMWFAQVVNSLILNVKDIS